MNENYLDIIRKKLYMKSTTKQSDKIKDNSRKSKKRKLVNGRSNQSAVEIFNAPPKKQQTSSDDTFSEQVTTKKEHKFLSDKVTNFKKLRMINSENKSTKRKVTSPKPKSKNGKKIKFLFSEYSSHEAFEEFQHSRSNVKRKSNLNCVDHSNRNINETIFEMDDFTNENTNINVHFDIDEFFDSKEPDSNESISTSHSGIDNELVSIKINKCKVHNWNVVDNAEPHYDLEVECNEKDLLSQNTNKKKVLKNSVKENKVILNGKINNGSLSADNSTELVNIPNTIDTPVSREADTTCNYKSFDVGYKKLIILEKNSLLSIFGLCSLKVLHGELEILGCNLTKTSKDVNVYSPRGSSLLVIKNVTKMTEKSNLKKIKNILTNANIQNVHIENTSVVFICSKLEETKITLLEKYISQQIFPKPESNMLPQIVFDPQDRFNIITDNPDWEKVVKTVTSSTKMLIAGGKGVGKSTFLRYTINKLLNKFKKVRVVDLDPGQSEFTVPGCISVVTVSDPVLGPNYTHLRKTDRSYLSNINVATNPKSYLEAVEQLMKFLDTLDKLPTLVNYMGFSTGLGIKIISSAITLICPTNVIQIDSSSVKKNFLTSLHPRTVIENCDFFGGDSSDLRYHLTKITSMTDDNVGWSLESRLIREMCALCYFGESMKNEAIFLTSHNLPLYEISLNNIKIMDCQGEEIPPAAVNANMVAFCSEIRNTLHIFTVLGYGIVRGIDTDTKTLVLMTLEPVDILENVHYLVLSSASLPASIYMTADGVTGSVPYVMEGELESLGQITKRSYLPAMKN